MSDKDYEVEDNEPQDPKPKPERIELSQDKKNEIKSKLAEAKRKNDEAEAKKIDEFRERLQADADIWKERAQKEAEEFHKRQLEAQSAQFKSHLKTVLYICAWLLVVKMAYAVVEAHLYTKNTGYDVSAFDAFFINLEMTNPHR